MCCRAAVAAAAAPPTLLQHPDTVTPHTVALVYFVGYIHTDNCITPASSSPLLTTVSIWYRVTRDVKEISQYLEYGPTRLLVEMPIAFTLEHL